MDGVVEAPSDRPKGNQWKSQRAPTKRPKGRAGGVSLEDRRDTNGGGGVLLVGLKRNHYCAVAVSMRVCLQVHTSSSI